MGAHGKLCLPRAGVSGATVFSKRATCIDTKHLVRNKSKESEPVLQCLLPIASIKDPYTHHAKGSGPWEVDLKMRQTKVSCNS